MIDFLEKGALTVLLLDRSDFELFHHAHTTCFLDKDDSEREDIADIKRDLRTTDSAEYWSARFYNAGNEACFVLVELTPKQKYQIAGIIDVDMDGNIPMVDTVHVMSTHRKRHLADMLYSAAEQFVLQETRFDSLRVVIAETNQPSIRAADRAGYVYETSTNRHNVYVRDLKHLRHIHNYTDASYPMGPGQN